jgi:hypothetical protein
MTQELLQMVDGLSLETLRLEAKGADDRQPAGERLR